jgi:NAD(P)-dependent dehydrogenase (short-subunit alcohol dehydrogenase family)
MAKRFAAEGATVVAGDWNATRLEAAVAGMRMDAAGAARAMTYAALAPATLAPEDIAALALFLASDESRHINGVIVPADAGWTAA